MNTNTRVSLVIPVYNEVDQIHACLEAVARQRVQPFEVLVVDNNSTDGTVAIARAFPFVTLLNESRQGVVYARDRGFNTARGDIIARIDADALIGPEWIETVVTLFDDKQVGAVSGAMTYRDVSMPRLVNRIDLFWRRRLARLLGSEVALQGASMALRRSVWQQIRGHVCHISGQHEDLDLAIHANQQGFNVRFDERLRANLCYRQAKFNVRAFCGYALLCPRTYKQHGLKSHRHMYPTVLFVLVMYPVISLICKGYDPRLQRFSLAQLLLAPTVTRVNPATFVD